VQPGPQHRAVARIEQRLASDQRRGDGLSHRIGHARERLADGHGHRVRRPRVELGAAGDEVAWLRMAPDGRVFALVTHDGGPTAGSTLVLVARDRPVGAG
jgi:hypothetical protein